LDTGKLVAGPFKIGDGYSSSIRMAFRLSADSGKLAVLSNWGRCLQVWNVQTWKLDVQKSTPDLPRLLIPPIFWTTKHKSIVAAFNLTVDATIYEFDVSTLETVGPPFQGHTSVIHHLALSSDCVLLVSSSLNNTIKLWAFESRQLLASFNVNLTPSNLLLSPNSRQLAYTNFDDTNIYICNIPANILASIGLAEEPQPTSKHSRRAGLFNSDATRHPVRRKSVIIPVMSPMPRPLPTSDPHTFLYFLRKLLSSSRMDEPLNPIDFPATSPLPRPLIKPDGNSRSTPALCTTKPSAINTSPMLISRLHRLSTWRPLQTNRASPTIVDVPLAPGKLRYATAGAPGNDDDLIRDEDYVSPPPSPNPGSRRVLFNAGQHGSSQFCFCF
jgi:hypothetical protein